MGPTMTRWMWVMPLLAACVGPSLVASPARGDEFQCPPPRSAPGGEAGHATWRPQAGSRHGMQMFYQTTPIEMPEGVAALEVELWGAGGGGGGGSMDTFSEAGAGGGGGASGGYARLSLDMAPRVVYVLVVGKGGAGGGVGADGEAGGASGVCRDAVLMVSAPGGDAGRGARTNERGGTAGSVAPGIVPATGAPGVRSTSNRGGNGMRPLFHVRGAGGRGGIPIAGTARPDGAFGGAGGAGEMRPAPAQPGSPGGDGVIVIRW